MTAATRAQLDRVATQYNATIEDSGTTLYLDAPAGFRWRSGAHCLAEAYREESDLRHSWLRDARHDLIERASYGLEECAQDCECRE